MFLRILFHDEVVNITEDNEKKITDHALLKIAKTTLKNHISPIEKPDLKPTVCKQIVSKLCVKKITSAYMKILDPCRK